MRIPLFGKKRSTSKYAWCEVAAQSAPLTTIETSQGGPCAVHLAARTKDGVGPCLCGFDRFARDEHGRMMVGFSVGGGTVGPGVRHEVCQDCLSLADGRPIKGTHANLFEEASA